MRKVVRSEIFRVLDEALVFFSLFYTHFGSLTALLQGIDPLSIDQSTNQSINPSFPHSDDWSINQSINQSIEWNLSKNTGLFFITWNVKVPISKLGLSKVPWPEQIPSRASRIIPPKSWAMFAVVRKRKITGTLKSPQDDKKIPQPLRSPIVCLQKIETAPSLFNHCHKITEACRNKIYRSTPARPLGTTQQVWLGSETISPRTHLHLASFCLPLRNEWYDDESRGLE